jgi:hypothetical protein
MGLELQQNLAVAAAARWPTWYQRDLQHRLEVGARRRRPAASLPDSTLSSSSPPIRLAVGRIKAADQPATGEWGPAMRLETPHCSVNVWLCAR